MDTSWHSSKTIWFIYEQNLNFSARVSQQN